MQFNYTPSWNRGRKKMVARYRDRLSIMYEILNIAADDSNRTTKSKIMYKAFLSYFQLKEYLQDLTEDELLSYDKEAQTYKTTEKGLRFVELYGNICEMIKEGEEQKEEQETELMSTLIDK